MGRITRGADLVVEILCTTGDAVHFSVIPPPRREARSSRRRRRPREVARAAHDNQTQCITSPQCLGIMWGGQGVAYGAPGRRRALCQKKT